MGRQKWCRGYLVLQHTTVTRFQMRAPIHPNHTEQIQLSREKMFLSSMQVRSNVAPSSSSLLWLSHSKSICNKLISPGALQPPWPHTGCAFSICCLSSQVHGMLSASCHSSYNCGLSKAFYNCIQDGESRQKSMFLSIHCPNERLNIALLARKARYKTSEDPHTSKGRSTIPS